MRHVAKYWLRQPITRIHACGSLWTSVMVYSFRSYFVLVVLKKSQSTCDKYARARSMAGCYGNPICRDSCPGTSINTCLHCFHPGINTFPFRTFLILVVHVLVTFGLVCINTICIYTLCINLSYQISHEEFSFKMKNRTIFWYAHNTLSNKILRKI